MRFLKNKFNNIVVTIVVLTIFIISGGIFLTFLGFGLFGISRILIFLKLGYFTYNKSFFDNLLYYGSYIVFGYFILFAIEHLMDYFRKQLPNNPYFNGATYHLISYIVTTVMFYFIIHIHYVYIKIEFWVIAVIIGVLYIYKIIFYPDSENLNENK
ncbi:SepA family multidrug efflux transporter [Staphylococcus pragensis]|uniref:Multidrug resistance efflux pump SepA n=1 Tax=Staphylococcus pragensis TaxID=1611836 RepID=A0A4Z1B2P8_9STAP|nr:SepA family multidrug efflux transporter [Staphylococcus pragensis]RTX89196.1 SepA family multidrug efflux transporter [Staphylococcus carnosus]TGN27733.1 SepA family multidrug efflux transporter [Staphylococcus pragensis]GGG90450.1 multidrug resistance efflux pump SepA [Staphylococcus pragensis]